jgi:hypothetical protein
MAGGENHCCHTLFKLGFKAIIAEVIKFGNLFIAVFKGVGRAFSAFGETISGRFEALGKDLAAFIEDPLGGVSFENTRAALETGLLDAMGNAFDQALMEAKEFNAAIDEEIQGAAAKIVEAREKKNASLDSLFQETNTPENTEETNKQTEKFTKLQREAQRIIQATRTPLERYNKEMELLNKLLKAGHINQETFGRAMEQAQEKFRNHPRKWVMWLKVNLRAWAEPWKAAWPMRWMALAVALIVSAILPRASSLT